MPNTDTERLVRLETKADHILESLATSAEALGEHKRSCFSRWDDLRTQTAEDFNSLDKRVDLVANELKGHGQTVQDALANKADKMALEKLAWKVSLIMGSIWLLGSKGGDWASGLSKLLSGGN